MNPTKEEVELAILNISLICEEYRFNVKKIEEDFWDEVLKMD